MNRIFKTGALAASPTADVPGYAAVPMRLAKNKIGLVKKAVFYLEGITTSDNGYTMALINRSVSNAPQDVGSYGTNIYDWYKNSQVMAIFSERMITSGFFRPFVFDFPEPYYPVIGDLTLMVIGGLTMASTVGGIIVYYEQKEVSLEDWQKVAKEY